MAGLCLIIQILTGIFLAMHYADQISVAFERVEHIMREVHGGWILRYLHANIASVFFITTYIHFRRGLFYGSFSQPRELVWIIGVIILLLMILTAFIGYVLPWGQMSFWGATVITRLASALPIVGLDLTHWLWGGFSVDNPTLNRFLRLHFLFPFLISAFAGLHVLSLHQYGSNNPQGLVSWSQNISFYPYFVTKDLVGWFGLGILIGLLVFWRPNFLGHPDNYMPANPMITPVHIVPEWYFLCVYAILRRIPSKLGGVIAVGFTFVMLFRLPALKGDLVRVSGFRPLNLVIFWVFIGNLLLLGWLGAQPVEDPYILCGQIASGLFFGYFSILVPSFNRLERSIRYKI